MDDTNFNDRQRIRKLLIKKKVATHRRIKSEFVNSQHLEASPLMSDLSSSLGEIVSEEVNSSERIQ